MQTHTKQAYIKTKQNQTKQKLWIRIAKKKVAQRMWQPSKVTLTSLFFAKNDKTIERIDLVATTAFSMRTKTKC